jgi:hypothetical protein
MKTVFVCLFAFVVVAEVLVLIRNFVLWFNGHRRGRGTLLMLVLLFLQLGVPAIFYLLDPFFPPQRISGDALNFGVFGGLLFVYPLFETIFIGLAFPALIYSVSSPGLSRYKTLGSAIGRNGIVVEQAHGEQRLTRSEFE